MKTRTRKSFIAILTPLAFFAGVTHIASRSVFAAEKPAPVVRQILPVSDGTQSRSATSALVASRDGHSGHDTEPKAQMDLIVSSLSTGTVTRRPVPDQHVNGLAALFRSVFDLPDSVLGMFRPIDVPPGPATRLATTTQATSNPDISVVAMEAATGASPTGTSCSQA